MKKIAYLLLILFALSLQNSQAWVRHRVVGGAPAAGDTPLSVDNTATLDQDANADPWTGLTLTVSCSADLVIVACSTSNNVDIGASGITIDGNAMTEGVALGNTARESVIYYLESPPCGADLPISVDWTSACDGGCYARSYIGASGVSGATSKAISGTNDTLNITCPSGDIALDVGGQASLEATTGSQTDIINGDDGGFNYWGSTEAGAGTNTMSWSWTSSVAGTHVGICVND